MIINRISDMGANSMEDLKKELINLQNENAKLKGESFGLKWELAKTSSKNKAIGLPIEIQSRLYALLCRKQQADGGMCIRNFARDCFPGIHGGCPMKKKCALVSEHDWLDYFKKFDDCKRQSEDVYWKDVESLFDVCDVAVKTFGNKQLDIAQEELAELIVAISHYKRQRQEHAEDAIYAIAEEWADCLIMLTQIAVYFDDSKHLFDKCLHIKAKRLKHKLGIE